MDPLSKLSGDDRWRSVVLDEVFKGLAHSPELSQMLIYKGARVLRLRLEGFLRASFDIDATLASITANVESPGDETLEKIRRLVHQATSAYFESHEPVRYELQQSTIVNRRKLGPHPRGWDVYWLSIQIRDLAAEGNFTAAGIQLKIDIAAPELLSDQSISPLVVDGQTINAVTLERIAGEKPRAFLSSLPTYRKKIGETSKVDRRVKDLYDLVRIIRKNPLANEGFWAIAGREFQLACRSRFIDCSGLSSFREDWNETRMAYAADKTLPNDVTFEEMESTIEQFANLLELRGFIPFTFELPNIPQDDE